MALPSNIVTALANGDTMTNAQATTLETYTRQVAKATPPTAADVQQFMDRWNSAPAAERKEAGAEFLYMLHIAPPSPPPPTTTTTSADTKAAASASAAKPRRVSQWPTRVGVAARLLGPAVVAGMLIGGPLAITGGLVVGAVLAVRKYGMPGVMS